MFRQQIGIKALQGERFFRWRGGAVSRIEGLTDAVIALAMTLLIVSLEVPQDFDAMILSFRQLPAFAACFAILAMVWFYHYQFHRRYGLENFVIVVLNTLLLFLLLFYVYPLKFMFTKLFDSLLFGGERGFVDGRLLLIVYGTGAIGVFGLFALMNLYAYRHRETLELSEVEQMVARSAIREQLIHVGFAATSILLAVLVHPAIGGLIYFGIGPAQGLNGWLSGRKIEQAAGS